VLLEENITSEGLFRVPPHSKLREVLKEAYDRGQKYIVWKDNGVTLPIPPYSQAEHQDEILAEVDPKDAYSVFMAAALIKAWYASLRQPIFPTTSYGDLKRLYGDADDIPDLERLKDLFSPTSEWSLLPGLSREIVVRHLLPLLDAIAARQGQNKMTAENLAVCFAPALLCGPDQIEDAKMSSIIRKIFTHATEMWSNGLREACEQSADTFYEELLLPKDDADWDDPVEEVRRSGESRASLEEQISGITLEDNEKSFEAYAQPYHEVANDDLPPPLPPRTRVPSARSSTDSTKRKPAPPLQIPPPRYSTVISDASADVAESPVTYAATTDGFAPRRPNDEQAPTIPPRWEQASDEKSGTRNSTYIPASGLSNTQTARSPVSGFSANFNIPKRKTLTAAQVDDAERYAPAPASTTTKTYDPNARNVYHPQGGMALPGLTRLPGLSINNESQYAAAPKRAPPAVPSSTQSERASPVSAISPTGSDLKPASATEFRRPSIPASVNRVPTITGLARPVYPSTPVNPVTGRPPSKSTSLPVPGPKPRTISPGLLHRMPSFESRQQLNPMVIERKMLTPNKLNLKKQSVEDLRRLYEERAGTASVLVEAGRWNNNR
jgi:Rho GTPase-activating protein 1